MLNCIYHPELRAVTSIYSGAHDWERVGLCKDCSERLHPFGRLSGRAFGTGTGKEAHAEAQESKRYAEDYDRARPTKERR
jgi:hypothetical protein